MTSAKQSSQYKTSFIVEPGKQEVVMTRVFDAPPELVHEVMNDPKLVPEYWGPAYLRTNVDKMEVRPGGQWRFVQTDPTDGSEHGFHGVYHSVDVEQTVRTFEYEGVPGHVLMETYRLAPHGKDGTLMTVTSVYQSVEDRDGMVAAGMESGATELTERLAALVAKAKGTA